MTDKQATTYRDIFAEITAKAQPLCEDTSDPEKITAYRVPVGPIHRAAGRVGFQMFDGEKRMQEMADRIAVLEGHPQKLGPSLEQRMPTQDQIHDGLQRALNKPSVSAAQMAMLRQDSPIDAAIQDEERKP